MSHSLTLGKTDTALSSTAKLKKKNDFLSRLLDATVLDKQTDTEICVI